MSSAAYFQQALLEELATVFGTMLGRAGRSAPAMGETLADWRIHVTAAGPWSGQVTLAFVGDEVARLAQLVMGLPAPADDTAVADMLLETANQALGALVVRPAFSGVIARAASPVRELAPADLAGASWLTVEFGQLAASMACLARIEAAAEAPAPAAPGPAAGGEPPAPRAGHGHGYPSNLDVILDIDLPLTVRFGEAEMTLEALTRLGPGSVIDLVRSPDEPVDVLVNGRLVARGEVVVVAGNYGVRVSEVVSAADRVRSMSA
jgi:flagellar motor switch protein FliN